MGLSPIKTQATFREKTEHGKSPATPVGKTPITPAEDQSQAGRFEDLSFWKRAREQFEKDLRHKGSHGKELTEFLGKTFTQQDAHETCRSLELAGGSSNPAIATILRHMDTFLALGDLLTAGAPQSVGLAWWAVRVMAGTVQRGHRLANEITEAMAELTGIMIRCRNTVQTWSLRSTKDSALHAQLMTRISPLYRNILEYSFHAHRFFSKSSLLRLTSFDRFTGLMQSINRAESQMEKDTSSLFQREMLQQQQRHVQQQSQRKSHRQVMQEEFQEYERQLDPLPLQEDILQQYCTKRHQNTLGWLFYDSFMYSNWHRYSRAVLWISGKEGSGKSTLAAAVIKDLQQTDDSTYCDYIFCGSDRAKTADRILATLIYRLSTRTEQRLDLLDRCNDILRALMEKRANTGPQTQRHRPPFSTQELISVFVKLLNHVFEFPCFIVLDGIDALEQKDRRQLYEALSGVMSEGIQPVRVLVTARSERVPPRDLSIPVLHMAIDEAEWGIGLSRVRLDISRCVDARVRAECNLSGDDAEIATIAIVNKAEDSFSYVDKAITFLAKPFAPPLQKRLRELPDNLENAYAQALTKVDADDADLLKTALKWTLQSHHPDGDIPLRVIRDDFYGTFTKVASGLPPRERNRVELDNEERQFADQLKAVGSAFLFVDSAYPRHVRLQGPSVKRYFFNKSNFVDEHCKPEHAYCSRCRTRLSHNSHYYFDEKVVALDFAITLLENLNSPLYQDVHFISLEEMEESAKVRSPSNISAQNSIKAAENKIEEHMNGVEAPGQPDDPEPESKLEEQKPGTEPGCDQTNRAKPDAGEPDARRDIAMGGLIDEDEVDSDKGSELDFLEEGSDDGYDKRLPGITASAEDYRCREEHRYEMTMWPSHLQELEHLWSAKERTGDRWDHLHSLMDQFVQTDNKAFRRWSYTLWQTLSEFAPEPTGEHRALHVAVLFHLPWLVRKMLDEGVNPAALTGPFNALHVAIDRRAPWEIHEMLVACVDVNAEPDLEDGVAPFDILLATDPEPELVRLYLHHGADCTRAYHDGSFAIHTFAKYGSQVEVLRLLLENGSDINTEHHKTGQTPLHYLLARGECPSDLLDEFLEASAHVNAEDSRSAMPLRAVARSGNLEAVKILIERGADIDDKDDKGMTAIHDAAMHGHEEIVNLLIEKGAAMNDASIDKGWTPLMYACRCKEGRTGMVLIERMEEAGNVNINCADAKGKTPLRKAAAHGMQALVEALLSLLSNDDIDKVDEVRGRSALHLASRNGHRTIVELLLGYGADPTLRDRDGKTSLDLCYASWFLEDNTEFEGALEMLIRMSPAEASQNTELVGDVAAKGSEVLTQALLDAGADFNKRDQYGWYALLHAIQNGHDHICDLIMRKRQSEVMSPSRLVSVLSIVTLSEDGLEATCDNSEASREIDRAECVTVVANSPVPHFFTDRGTFYFEIESFATSRDKDGKQDDMSVFYMAIGMCAKPRKLLDWAVGTYQRGARSWAYLDSGEILSENADLEYVRSPYSVGDTVGCGFTSMDRAWNCIFWTLNGVFVDVVPNVKGCLYPAVHLYQRTKVVANFGDDLYVKPFKFKMANEKGFASRGYEFFELQEPVPAGSSRGSTALSGRSSPV